MTVCYFRFRDADDRTHLAIAEAFSLFNLVIVIQPVLGNPFFERTKYIFAFTAFAVFAFRANQYQICAIAHKRDSAKLVVNGPSIIRGLFLPGTSTCLEISHFSAAI